MVGNPYIWVGMDKNDPVDMVRLGDCHRGSPEIKTAGDWPGGQEEKIGYSTGEVGSLTGVLVCGAAPPAGR
jgi:hypothetical protein